MLEKYINWDEAVKRMLRSREDNQIALENLREQYAELTQSVGNIGSMDYSKPRVTGTGKDPQDAMVNQILHKQEIQRRITELEKEDKLYTRAWDALTEDERRILQEFFQMGHRPTQRAVDTLCETYGYERTKIYDLRRDTLHRFKRLIIG